MSCTRRPNALRKLAVLRMGKMRFEQFVSDACAQTPKHLKPIAPEPAMSRTCKQPVQNLQRHARTTWPGDNATAQPGDVEMLCHRQLHVRATANRFPARRILPFVSTTRNANQAKQNTSANKISHGGVHTWFFVPLTLARWRSNVRDHCVLPMLVVKIAFRRKQKTALPSWLPDIRNHRQLPCGSRRESSDATLANLVGARQQKCLMKPDGLAQDPQPNNWATLSPWNCHHCLPDRTRISSWATEFFFPGREIFFPARPPPPRLRRVERWLGRTRPSRFPGFGLQRSHIVGAFSLPDIACMPIRNLSIFTPTLLPFFDTRNGTCIPLRCHRRG